MYVILDTASVKISFTQNSVQIFDAILRSLYTSFVLSSSLTLNSVLLWVRLTWISLHNILCGYYTNCVKMLHKIACYFECNINTTYCAKRAQHFLQCTVENADKNDILFPAAPTVSITHNNISAK